MTCQDLTAINQKKGKTLNKNGDQEGQEEETDFWAVQDVGSVSISIENEGRVKD